MPLYEYQCGACGARFELIRRFSDPPLETCPTCGKGPVEKLVSSPAFQFKGSGWYITDYARKSEGTAAKGEAAPTGEAAKSGTTGSTTPAASKDAPAAPSSPAGTSGSKDK